MKETIKVQDSTNIALNRPDLSDQETRAILTPFAFKIDQDLFGVSLAKPYKRAIALAIDLLLIALLSDAPGELLAVVIAITLLRLGNKKSTTKIEQINKQNSKQNNAPKQAKVKGRKRRAILRGFGVFIIFVLLLDTLPTLFSYFDNDKNHSSTVTTAPFVVKNDEGESEEYSEEGIKIRSVSSAIELTALAYGIKKLSENSVCTNYQCWSKELEKFVTKDLADDDLSLSKKEINKLINRAVSKTNLTKQEQARLETYLYDQYSITKAQSKSSTQATKSIKTAELTTTDTVTKGLTSDNTQHTNANSIIAWIKGIINDLGLEFGWSAFYFTVLTALWHGQTLGKKVVGIKVLQLDGTPLTLWDSFGRYGGYGAGIATGLLGFMQIFWDANRQAIHDKISATVVIDVKK